LSVGPVVPGRWARAVVRGVGAVAEQPGPGFAELLRQLRAEAGLTQEELAEAARLSPRSVSDLERGIHRTARRDTAGLLADALSLAGPVRTLFVAAARGRVSAAEVLTARQGYPPGAFQAAASRTLPRDSAAFTGRQAELAQLMGTLASMAADGRVVGIHAIGGMAGVGKTAFAVHAAHRLAERFPAGQIFLSLHGHTPGQQPVDPGDALARLLLIIGVPAGQIPPGLEARMALWRDRVAGGQLLLVLDDAVSSEQVRPLLPGTGRSLVLVTSRRRLTALEDATAISLGTLPPGEAADLLVRLAGRAGPSPADPAIREIARLCGYLPLATLHRICGDLQQAGSCHQKALDLAHQIGDPWDEAHALAGLGRCALAAGCTAEAEDKLRQALKIFQRIGTADAADVSRELDALVKAAPAGSKLKIETSQCVIQAAPQASQPAVTLAHPD